jgi:hypothetical protein
VIFLSLLHEEASHSLTAECLSSHSVKRVQNPPCGSGGKLEAYSVGFS